MFNFSDFSAVSAGEMLAIYEKIVSSPSFFSVYILKLNNLHCSDETKN